jgi:hypothetical protein
VAVFSLGQIVWWMWMGIIMLRDRTSTAAEKPDVFVLCHRTTT